MPVLAQIDAVRAPARVLRENGGIGLSLLKSPFSLRRHVKRTDSNCYVANPLAGMANVPIAAPEQGSSAWRMQCDLWQGGLMAARMSTHPGDVLILRTNKSFSTHAVGPITKDGQQDFQGQTSVKYVRGRAKAEAEAKALVAPGRRIIIRDLDTGDWSDLS